jgi:hypothetical protein
MLSLLSVVFHFAALAADPHWTCELEHRDPGIAGTYYMYCSQMSPDGVELIDVGHFISDAKAARLAKAAKQP